MIHKINTALIWVQNYFVTIVNGIIRKCGGKRSLILWTYFTLPKFQPKKNGKKICIIGGGANGLLLAWELNQLGFETKILEKSDRIGGRTHSQKIDGSQLDKSTMWLHSGYHRIRLILNTFGMHIYTDGYPSVFIDNEESSLMKNCKKYSKFARIALLAAIFKYFYHSFRFLLYRLFLYMGWPVKGFSIRKEISMTYDEWLKYRNLEILKPLIYAGVSSQGYGFPNETPVYYLFQWLRPVVALSALNPFSCDVQEVLEGWETLWKRMASDQDVEFNIDVEIINNFQNEVEVIYQQHKSNKSKSEKFDYVVMACPLKESLKIIKNKPAELYGLASKFNINKYMTALVRYNHSKLPLKGRGYFMEEWDDVNNMGLGKLCVFKRHVKPSNSPNQQSKYILLGSSCHNFINIAEFKNTISNCDWLDIEEVIDINEFPYFPWISSKDVKNGTLEALYKNRKFQRVYYTGPEFSFESINLLSEHAYLIAREIYEELFNSESWNITKKIKRFFILFSFSRL